MISIFLKKVIQIGHTKLVIKCPYFRRHFYFISTIFSFQFFYSEQYSYNQSRIRIFKASQNASIYGQKCQISSANPPFSLVRSVLQSDIIFETSSFDHWMTLKWLLKSHFLRSYDAILEIMASWELTIRSFVTYSILIFIS